MCVRNNENGFGLKVSQGELTISAEGHNEIGEELATHPTHLPFVLSLSAACFANALFFSPLNPLQLFISTQTKHSETSKRYPLTSWKWINCLRVVGTTSTSPRSTLLSHLNYNGYSEAKCNLSPLIANNKCEMLFLLEILDLRSLSVLSLEMFYTSTWFCVPLCFNNIMQVGAIAAITANSSNINIKVPKWVQCAAMPLKIHFWFHK